MAVSATSGTVVLADGHGEPLGPALLYDDRRVPAPERWDWLLRRHPGAAHAWHASDMIVHRLTGTAPMTDWSHALKTGYDPGDRCWAPADAAPLRPEVAAPTTEAGTVGTAAAADTGLPAGCSVRLGMTDGCAAQLGAGADRPGRFVTVLGTTLVVKGAGDRRIDDAPSGVYSHRHPDGWWLPGGASNTGGGSLTARFDGDELDALDEEAGRLGPAKAVCYPLPGTGKGERFPFVADDAEELWTSKPDGRVEEYRAVLEGVAFLERLGYERLGDLGAPLEGPLRTAGAGAASTVWTAIRATVLDVPIATTAGADTAFGACVLAAAGTIHDSLASATDAMVATMGPPAEPVEAQRDRLEDGYRRFVAALSERGWLPWRG